MARFLFTVWPFSGHVHPAMAIALALRARGHEIAFYTGAGAKGLIESEEFRLFPFRRIDEDKVTRIAGEEFRYTPSNWERLRNANHQKEKFREWMVDTIPLQVDDIVELMREWTPDVFVCDLSFWGPVLVLNQLHQIPVAVLSVVAACLLPGPDAPLWGQGARRPGKGEIRLPYSVRRKLIQWLSASFQKSVTQMRQRYNLPPLPCSTTEYLGKMPLYLVPSTPEYDYQRRDLPPSVHYVGPCLWDKPGAAPAPAWLSELSSDRPLIYVTEATLGTVEPFLLKTAAQAFRDLRAHVVMTTGRQRDPNEIRPLCGPNTRVESYIPQSDLLPRTSLAVTAGGSGGVLAALGVGVPLVVVPTEWDRPENAQRVVEAGAGLRINPEHCTPERLKAAAERVLSEPSFRSNAQRIADAFSRYGGPSYAAELIEKLAAGSSRKPVMRKVAGSGDF